MFDISPLRVLCMALACATLWGGAARACDDLADKLLSLYLDPAIKSLGCSALRKAGVDKADHKLESVCYTSSGPTSAVEIVVNLHCHTGGEALIPISISERVTADAQVRGADCNVQSVSVRPSGEIGKILASAFNLDGSARKALQDGLSKLCSGQK
jgi:hypothetical protein